jgi:hypothetical protein
MLPSTSISFFFLTVSFQISYRLVVFATDLGNPPVVRVLTSGSVQFSSRPGPNPNPLLSWRGGTRPGHRTANIWPGYNLNVVPNSWFQQLWLQLSIWVLIVQWHEQYVDCAELWALSPPAFRFVIWLIFVELLWNKGQFWEKFGGIRLRLYEWLSDCIFDRVRRKCSWNCTIYVLIMLQYDQNSST